MVDANQNLNSSHDLVTPLSGMVCHLRATNYYDHQPIY